MALTIGFTSSSGSPVIKLTIAGAFPASATEFEVTVDTGFTGFISMPIMSALPLGLPLYGTTSVEFGDGSTASRFTALGVATLGGESETGVIILEPSTNGVLVGMEFLKKFRKSVVMHRGILFLIDESVLAHSDLGINEEEVRAAAKAGPSPPPSGPPETPSST